MQRRRETVYEQCRCVTVRGADADVCVVFVCSWATLRFLLRVREETWGSYSGWCRRRGRMQ
jgi:hypothetical protein